jgi:hypothetical protein
MISAGILEELLLHLPVLPTQEGGEVVYSALPIPGFERHRLARSIDGEPALLLAARGQDEIVRPLPIQLEHVSVQHQVICNVRGAGEIVQQTCVTVVQFSGGNTHLRRYFLRVCGSLLQAVGQEPTAVEVKAAVTGLVELFRAILRPGRKTVQGLWAELFVLASATDPVALVKAWHTSPEERYDFHGGQERIEVKSALGRVRRHRFSLEQLQPPAGTDLTIASILLEHSPGGAPLGDLLDTIRARLFTAPALQSAVDRTVAETLGDSLQRALDVRFDRELAIDTLQFFSHLDVPRIDSALPSYVSDVSFTADLSGAVARGPSPSEGVLLRAARPKHG